MSGSGIPEFIATADSEASDVESPRFEDVTGAEILTDARISRYPLQAEAKR